MNDIDNFLSGEIERFNRLLNQSKTEPNIFIVFSGSSGLRSRFSSIVSRSEKVILHIKDHHKPINIRDDEIPDYIGSGGRFILFESNCDLDDVMIVKKAYELLQKRPDIGFIIISNHDDPTDFESDLDMIPSFIIKRFRLVKPVNNFFQNWFRQQIPSCIDESIIEIIINGTGMDFSRADMFLSAFFEHNSREIVFVSSSGKKSRDAIYPGPNQTIVNDNYEEIVQIPSKIFIFDTSAIMYKNLPGFINRVSGGEFYYPYFIMKEVHKKEEEMKRKDRTIATTIRNNLSLMKDRLRKIDESRYSVKMSVKDVDIKILNHALRHACIVVSSDKMIIEQCRVLDIPSVFFIIE